jgi:UDP-glucose 4-epimerase
MARVLVTGAAGFLGYYLAAALADDRHNVVYCVDNFIRGSQDNAYEALIARPNVQHFSADLTERGQVMKLPDDVDQVYHLAALNGTQNFYERPFEVVRCCTLPTFYLLEKYGSGGRLNRFIYAGTSEAYAGTVSRFGWPVPTAEDVPLSIDDVTNERWSYGASKLHGEVLTINGCRHFHIPYTVIRYHNAYGPRMGDKHVIGEFLLRLKSGVLELYGYDDTRAFIYASDATAATILAGNSPNLINEIINIGGEREIRILDLAKLILAETGRSGQIKLFPSPKGSVRRRAPSLAKLRRLTSFREAWSLESGLKETARWYLG